MFQWLLGTRRRTRDAPISDQERQRLLAVLWQARYLPVAFQENLIRWCRVFLKEKSWEGCNGQSIDVRIQWSIAASAGMMVRATDDWYFDRTETILVYPTPYVAKVESRFVESQGGIPSIMGEFPRAGQTQYRGPVIVNWQDTAFGCEGPNEGQHLVVHEFAHQLDLINSPYPDGLPPLPAGQDEEKWRQRMKEEMDAARSLVANGYRVLINDYGLTQPSEFFAVASELFFQWPHALREFHPNVFSLLLDFYQVDLTRFLPQPTALAD